MATAQVILQLQNQASSGLKKTASDADALKQSADQAQRALDAQAKSAIADARALASLDAAQARLARSTGDAAQASALEASALSRLNGALTTSEASSRDLVAVKRQIVTVEQQVARAEQQLATEAAKASAAQEAAASKAAAATAKLQAAANKPSFSAQFTTGLKDGLLGIIGPAALATAAIAGVGKAIESFNQGIQLKAQLDTTNAALAYQIGNLRDYGQANREAQAFADQFKLTQTQLAATMQAAIPVYRQSNASTTDILTTFARLQSTAPEQPISEAARAIRELATGDVTSIKELFNVPSKDALAMKNAIEAGQDPIRVVSEYLDRAGAGAELLKIQTEGATGAMKDLQRAQEDFNKAQGEFASGPGLVILQGQIASLRVLTKAFEGDFQSAGEITKAQSDANVEATNQWLLSLFGVKQATQEQTTATQEQTTAYGAYVAAVTDATGRQEAYNAVARDMILLSSEDIVKKQQQQLETDRLKQFNNDLRDAAVRVAAGLSDQAVEAAKLAAKYPELGGQVGAIINREAQLAGTIDLANQKLREQQLLAQANPTNADAKRITGLTGRDPGVNAPGRTGNSVDDFDKEIQRRKDVAAAQRDQVQALETTAQRVARLRREEAAATKDSADQVKITTQRILAERQLAQEQEAAAKKGAKAGASRVAAAQSTALQLTNIEESAAAERERIVRDSQERLADMEQDYQLRRSRAAEDFERRKRRLLAEGKIFEARQAQEEFDREQRRAQEDYQIQQARQKRDTAERLGDQAAATDRKTGNVTERASLKGVTTGPLPTTAGTAGALPAAPPGAPAGGPVIKIEFAPIQLLIDGQVAGAATYPYIEARLTGDLTRIAVAAPPQVGTGSGAAGARP